MARLIVIRHGESVANAEARFTTGPDEPLTERGRREADAVASHVARHFRAAALYASPFARALATAEHVGRAVGLVPVVVEPLREQSFGELRGRPYADYRGDPSAAGLGAWRRRPPGGETLLEVAHRIGPEIDAIAARHLGEDVVVVCHGAVMAALRGWAARDFEARPQPTRNGEGYVLARGDGGYALPEGFSF